LPAIRVWIEPRDACISDMVCVALCSEVFDIDAGDGKSFIRVEWRLKPTAVSEGEVPEDLKECVKAASENCPVDIIHFKEKQG